MSADLLRFRPQGQTAADLRAARRAVEEHLAELNAAITADEARAGELALDGNMAALAEVEQRLAEARASIARLNAMLPAFPPRIAAAEAREDAARLDTLAAEAEAKAAHAAALIPDIEAAALRLAEAVEAHDDAAAAVQAANRELHAAGRARVVHGNARQWPEDPRGRRPVYLGGGMALPGPFGTVGTAAELRRALERAKAPPPPMEAEGEEVAPAEA